MVIEVDGAVHLVPSKREQDAVRDTILTALGFTVVRVKEADLYPWRIDGVS